MSVEQKKKMAFFKVETPPDQAATDLFRSGQALTRIHDLTVLDRDRAVSAFYEELQSLLFGIVDEGSAERDHVPSDIPDGHNYSVDYCFRGHDENLVFLTVCQVGTRHGGQQSCCQIFYFMTLRLNLSSFSPTSGKYLDAILLALPTQPEQRWLRSTQKTIFAARSCSSRRDHRLCCFARLRQQADSLVLERCPRRRLQTL